MGDLKGHAIPGTFFMLYGLWWGYCCARKYYKNRRDGKQYVSTSTYSLDCFGDRLRRLPMEAFVKVVLSTAGMLGEIIAHLPGPIPMGIVQHATMYFFFAMAGVVDIVMHYGVPIPPASDYIAMVIALVVEGLLFAYHIHGRSELDIHIHQLLVYVIFLTAVVIALESKFQRSVILSMGRSYLVMLQGTWFWAVGIILYGHDEGNGMDQDDPMSVMQASIYFSWHCAILFVLLFIITVTLSCLYRRQGEGYKGIPMTAFKPVNGRQDQYGILAIVDPDEDESDVEFDRTVPNNNTTSVS